MLILIYTASLLPQDPAECKTCSYLVNTVGKGIASNTTEAEITSSLDNACADLGADTNCESFLNAHRDELVPQIQELGDDEACLIIEMCTQDELEQEQVN